MASIEFLQKRIAGKEAEIEKLEKKLQRILKAQESNWENNPYYYSETDIKYTTRDLEDAKKSLADYQSKLNAENQKANSRNIPVILEFLDQWKQRVLDYYKSEFGDYLVALEEWRTYEREYTEWSNHKAFKLRQENKDEYNRIHREYNQKRDAYRSRWNFITAYVDYSWIDNKRVYLLDEAKLQKDIDRDADAKYDFIIERTNSIVGQITDASDLKIGDKGDLNGIIIGTDGKAKVETIGAGGYNETVILDSGRHGQRFHFRTLIKKVK